MINPTSEQLELINRYTPAQLPPLVAEELIVLTFIGADNILNRSRSRWRTKELIQMASLCPGLPLTLDHDWEDVSKVQGVIFDSRVSKVSDINILNAAKNSAGNVLINEAIISVEGLIHLEFDAAIPVNSQVLEALRLGLIGKVSLGGFRFRERICPICNRSLSLPDCPHKIPWDNTEDALTVPYYIRADIYDLMEASIVLTPNLPGAGIKLRSSQ